MPCSMKQRLLSQSRLAERLLRLESRVAFPLNNTEYLVSYTGKMYHLDIQTKQLTEELTYRTRMKNPLSLVGIKGLKGFMDCILFGEYLSNNDFTEVNVWRRLNGKWEVAFSFPAGSIYHIHGIVPDYHNHCIYILTGDSDNESAIWKCTEDFKKVIPILIGSQQYRSCVAFPYKEGVLYATDTARETNHLYYAHPSDGKWKIEPVSEIPGPCIFGAEVDGAYYFATSVEADDTLPPSRYRFSYKLGEGVKDHFSYVVKVTKEGCVEEVLKYRKDIWPMLLFQFGNVRFPHNESKELVVCPQSVRKFDNKTIIYDK